MIDYDKHAWCGLRLFVAIIGSVMPRTLFLAIASSGMTIVLAVHGYGVGQELMEEVFGHPYSFQVYAVFFSFLLVFRSSLAYGRYWEGITNVVQMHAKLGDACLQAIAFDENTPLDKPAGEKIAHFCAHLVHLVSLMSALAMQELNGDTNLDNLVQKQRKTITQQSDSWHLAAFIFPRMAHHKLQPVKYEVLHGFQEGETFALIGAKDRVGYVLTRVVRLLSQRIAQGGLAMPPPIVSRTFQEFSNGALGYSQALKIANVPFPFPYAQMIGYSKLVFTLTCPLVMAGFTNNVAMATILNFVTVVGFLALNEVADELEDPFGRDANDLPLVELHDVFNKVLEKLITTKLESYDDVNEIREKKLKHANAHINFVNAKDKAIGKGPKTSI